jgi:hypothetical protein
MAEPYITPLLLQPYPHFMVDLFIPPRKKYFITRPAALETGLPSPMSEAQNNDINLIVQRANVTRNEAANAYNYHHGDLIGAAMEFM